MTNFEFYKEKLSEISAIGRGRAIAIVDGKPIGGCYDLNCEECDRCNNCTDAALIKWLLSEHIEETENDKICKKLKIDDKVLVSNDGKTWGRRYYAGYDRGMPLTFHNGKTSWSNEEGAATIAWNYIKLPEEVDEQND